MVDDFLGSDDFISGDIMEEIWRLNLEYKIKIIVGNTQFILDDVYTMV